MTKPKISVIIPIYNTAKYLEETLNSILNQTIIDDIEVLMIDDGSIDDSRYIIERYALDYDNFYAYHKENEGQGIARNYGLDLANGEYIHFLDSDDYLVPEAYEKLYDLAISNDYDFVVGNVLRFNWYSCWEDQLFKNSFGSLTGNTEFNSINEHPALVWDTSASNKFYKKSFLDKNNIRFIKKKIFYEDLLFSINAYIKSDSFFYFDEFFYYWRSRQDSSSGSQSISSIIKFKDRLEIILEIRELFKNSNIHIQTLNKLYEKWLLHDLKMFVKHINDHEPQYYEELLDEILDIIEDIPQNIKDGLKSYHKIIYKMIENRDIDSLLYFAPLEDTLKKNPNLKLNLNENYLKLIDFNKDVVEEELESSIVNIENDENNLFIEFKWNIDYLDNIRPNIQSLLVDDNNQEYPLEIQDNNIIIPFELLANKKQIKIKMICSTDSFKKESYLKNDGRSNVNVNNINLEIGIGRDSVLCISSRNINQNNIIIDDITFDGQYFIFKGCTEFEINEIIIENVINFTKFSYPICFNSDNFTFKIPYSDIVKFPVKKWELKGDYLIKLANIFRFFRNYDDIFFSNRRNIILIEDNIYDIFERINKLNDDLNSATQTNRILSQENQKLTDDNTKFKELNSNLTNNNNKLDKRNTKLKKKNEKLNEKNQKLKQKNQKLKEKNQKFKDKNKKLSNTIEEYKSRKIVRIADKFK